MHGAVWFAAPFRIGPCLSTPKDRFSILLDKQVPVLDSRHEGMRNGIELWVKLFPVALMES